MAVSNANRKTCGICGRDVTFAKRTRDASGKFLCELCTKEPGNEETSHSRQTAPTPHVELRSEATPPATSASAIQQMLPKPEVPKRKGPTSIAIWITGIVVAAVLTIGIAIWLIVTPSWDEANRARIDALRTEAETLLAQHKPKESYAKFKELFAFIGDHKIANKYIQSDIDAARILRDRAYAQAKPVIDREEADERARVESQKRMELERLAKEQTDRARLERERKQDEIARRERERQQQTRETREKRLVTERAIFRQSREYASLQSEAERITSGFEADMITEDSAYRGISRSAEASRDLLAILIKIQARLAGRNMDAQISRVLSSSRLELAGEDSAIRAIYLKDQTSLKLLGVWCNVLSKDDPNIVRSFSDEQLRVSRATTGDDSAPRAIDAYSEGCMRALALIASAKGFEAPSMKVVDHVNSGNVGENSTWRSSMRHAKGQMELVLLMLDKDDDAEVRRLRSEALLKIETDDSALRAQLQYRRGIVRGLRMLIAQ